MISECWFVMDNQRHIRSVVKERLRVYHGFGFRALPKEYMWEVIVAQGAEYVLLHRVINDSDWDEAIVSFLKYSNGLVA